MNRDRRLLAAMLFFLVALSALLVQAWVVRLYLNAAIMGNWSWFGSKFHVAIPPFGPNKFCFDYCAPDLPFVAGWIGIASFIFGLLLLCLAWWKPKKSEVEAGSL